MKKQQKVSSKEMQEFFLEIWKVTPKNQRICYETGKWLGNEPLTTFFHHLLEKSKYPEYSLCKWNIVLLSQEIHEQVHLNIDKCPRIKDLRERLYNALHTS